MYKKKEKRLNTSYVLIALIVWYVEPQQECIYEHMSFWKRAVEKKRAAFYPWYGTSFFYFFIYEIHTSNTVVL